MRCRAGILALVALAAAPSVVAAEVAAVRIVTTEGAVVNGRLLDRTPSGFLVEQPDGTSVHVSYRRVATAHVTGEPDRPAAPRRGSVHFDITNGLEYVYSYYEVTGELNDEITTARGGALFVVSLFDVAFSGGSPVALSARFGIGIGADDPDCRSYHGGLGLMFLGDVVYGGIDGGVLILPRSCEWSATFTDRRDREDDGTAEVNGAAQTTATAGVRLGFALPLRDNLAIAPELRIYSSVANLGEARLAVYPDDFNSDFSSIDTLWQVVGFAGIAVRWH